jgi:hypothetical protein
VDLTGVYTRMVVTMGWGVGWREVWGQTKQWVLSYNWIEIRSTGLLLLTISYCTFKKAKRNMLNVLTTKKCWRRYTYPEVA